MSNRVRERALEIKLKETAEREQMHISEILELRMRIERVKHLINEYCCYCDYNGSYDTGLVSLKRETLAELSDILDGKE